MESPPEIRSALPDVLILLSPPSRHSAVERAAFDRALRGLVTGPQESHAVFGGPLQVSIPSSSHLPTHERDLATSPGSDTATLVDSDEQYTSYLRDLKIVDASVSNSISGPPAPVVHAEVNLRPPKATAAYMHPLYSQGLDTTSMRQHRYTLGAKINQVLPEDRRDEYSEDVWRSVFNMHLDTGSSNAWVRAENYRKLLRSLGLTVQGDNNRTSIIDVPEDNSQEQWLICDWGPNDRPHAMNYDLINHGYTSTVQNGREIPAAGVTLAKAGYLDSSQALMVLQPPPGEVISFQDCYDWGKSAWTSELKLDFRLGAAIAISQRIVELDIFGIMGLSPSMTMRAFLSKGVSTPSMLGALHDGALPAQDVSARTQGATNRDLCLQADQTSRRSVTMFLSLYLPTYRSKSWLALNNFPRAPNTVIPDFSDIIPVTKDAEWSIALSSFRVSQGDVQGPQISFKPPRSVLLDTGSSLSYLPREIADYVIHDMGRLPRGGNNALDKPYTLHVPDSNPFTVHFEFVGVDDELVSVQCPLDPFICTANPKNPPTADKAMKEGLVFGPYVDDRRKEHLILGLNFFQAMHVELCYLVDETPYVRLAPKQGDDCQIKLPKVRAR